MSTLAARLAPLAVAAVVALGMAAGYADLLLCGTDASRAVVPAAAPPLAVTAEGTRLRVVTGAEAAARRVEHVDALAIGWNLPVLVALWGWVLPHRWRWGLAALALLVLAHVLVADLGIRRLGGALPRHAELLWRAWYAVLAPLAPFALVAGGWIGLRPRAG